VRKGHMQTLLGKNLKDGIIPRQGQTAFTCKRSPEVLKPNTFVTLKQLLHNEANTVTITDRSSKYNKEIELYWHFGLYSFINNQTLHRRVLNDCEIDFFALFYHNTFC